MNRLASGMALACLLVLSGSGAASVTGDAASVASWASGMAEESARRIADDPAEAPAAANSAAANVVAAASSLCCWEHPVPLHVTILINLIVGNAIQTKTGSQRCAADALASATAEPAGMGAAALDGATCEVFLASVVSMQGSAAAVAYTNELINQV